MEKRGQLGIIEFKYAVGGFVVGLIAGFVLVLLGSKKVLPFEIPLVCGSILFANKKAQLGAIEAKFAIIGFFIGLIVALVLVYLGSAGVLPFEIPWVCAAPAK